MRNVGNHIYSELNSEPEQNYVLLIYWNVHARNTTIRNVAMDIKQWLSPRNYSKIERLIPEVIIFGSI